MRGNNCLRDKPTAVTNVIMNIRTVIPGAQVVTIYQGQRQQRNEDEQHDQHRRRLVTEHEISTEVRMQARACVYERAGLRLTDRLTC